MGPNPTNMDKLKPIDCPCLQMWHSNPLLENLAMQLAKHTPHCFNNERMIIIKNIYHRKRNIFLRLRCIKANYVVYNKYTTNKPFITIMFVIIRP